MLLLGEGEIGEFFCRVVLNLRVLRISLHLYSTKTGCDVEKGISIFRAQKTFTRYNFMYRFRF